MRIERITPATTCSPTARGLYEKPGWRAIGTDHDGGLTMTIMRVDGVMDVRGGNQDGDA